MGGHRCLTLVVRGETKNHVQKTVARMKTRVRRCTRNEVLYAVLHRSCRALLEGRNSGACTEGVNGMDDCKGVL